MAETSATAQSSASAGGSGVSNPQAAVSSSSAASSSSTGGVVTCDGQYGSAAGYVLCKDGSQGCEFKVDLDNKTNCGEVCSTLGGQCTATFDDGVSACSYISGAKPCDAKYVSAICQCVLACGGGPPCATGWTCNNGTCIH